MLTPQIAPDVVAQCQIAAGEIGQALTRAFDNPLEATIGEPTSLRFLDASEGLASPGVVITLHIGLAAMAILVPQAGGSLPRGYDSTDPKAQNKLTTLAQELGLLVLPEALLAEDAQGFCVNNLSQALREGGATDTATVVPLLLKSAAKREEALIIWPLSDARKITRAIASHAASASSARQTGAYAAATETATVAATESSIAAPGDPDETNSREAENNDPSVQTAGAPLSRIQPPDESRTASPRSGSKHRESARGPSLRDLPPYSRSLLKIRVPLSVTLAEKKQPLGQILEIGPGSILQFEKSCEEMLDLNVSNLPIARGEAVKVGDKFGLRVTSLILPSERFKAVQTASAGSLPIPA